mmetsp:Transcript_54771/g.173970  ORF Transcript_54771/g.173970 Transcript_54771/m.173970 type:complete len:223 (-) Transcript_54771:870-1538(-)
MRVGPTAAGSPSPPRAASRGTRRSTRAPSPARGRGARRASPRGSCSEPTRTMRTQGSCRTGASRAGCGSVTRACSSRTWRRCTRRRRLPPTTPAMQTGAGAPSRPGRSWRCTWRSAIPCTTCARCAAASSPRPETSRRTQRRTTRRAAWCAATWTGAGGSSRGRATSTRTCARCTLRSSRTPAPSGAGCGPRTRRRWRSTRRCSTAGRWGRRGSRSDPRPPA